MDSGLDGMELIKYRDVGMHTYTYFWISKTYRNLVSPYFDSEAEAHEWHEQQHKSFELRKNL
jgi:hypothetical protein